MHHRATLLAGICGLLLSAAAVQPAMAAAPAGFAGAIDGEYANANFSGGGGNADIWGITAAGAFSLGRPDLGAQIDGGWHRWSGSGADLDQWNIGGSLFWAPAFGRVGATVAYTSLDLGGGLDINATSYGVFGEYFFSDVLTFGAHGGGVTASGLGSSDTGGYIGGGLTGYIIPNFALMGTIDYFDVAGGSTTTYGVGAEWQVSQMLPVSVYGGYRYNDFSGGGGHVDVWFIGVRFYAGGMGMPLVGNHRNGTLGWVGQPLRNIQF